VNARDVLPSTSGVLNTFQRYVVVSRTRTVAATRAPLSTCTVSQDPSGFCSWSTARAPEIGAPWSSTTVPVNVTRSPAFTGASGPAIVVAEP
jgi:hypothetical protein